MWNMDISKGHLDDIWRPAARGGIQSVCERESPRSMQIIGPDVTAGQGSERSHENTDCPAQNSPADEGDRLRVSWGSLEDVSLAVGESCNAEIRRQRPSCPGSLEVLSLDSTETKFEGFTLEEIDCSEENISDGEDSNEENEDPELRGAVQEMKRLDGVLALKVSAEREVKRRGKELRHKLWQELQAVSPSRTSESSDETENTRRFLSLTLSSCQGDGGVDFEPVFETEVLHLKSDLNSTNETDEHTHTESVDCAEAGERVREGQVSDSRRHEPAHKKSRQDFIKRNIELAAAAGNSVLLTQRERERIDELLKDLDEEQDDSDLKPEMFFSLCAASPPAGGAFTPEPSELSSLNQIDSKLQLLLPVQDFLSVQSPCSDPSGLLGSDEGDLREKVLWDVRERWMQEMRLREIQQQLQLLQTDQSTFVCLSEDHLKNLLLECERDVIRASLISPSEASEASFSLSSELNTSSTSLQSL